MARRLVAMTTTPNSRDRDDTGATALMSQRDSGYERKERDLYETPEWVTEALMPHIPERVASVWEPAMGSGKMLNVLLRQGYRAFGGDISTGQDFLLAESSECDAIITNPPYEHARMFVVHAIHLTARSGFSAMLLRTDYDHASTRKHLFMPPFAKKLVLTKRIRWFEDSKGSPSFNHAWFIWDWKHSGPPTLAYGP
jgi:hypothetical protein